MVDDTKSDVGDESQKRKLAREALLKDDVLQDPPPKKETKKKEAPELEAQQKARSPEELEKLRANARKELSQPEAARAPSKDLGQTQPKTDTLTPAVRKHTPVAKKKAKTSPWRRSVRAKPNLSQPGTKTHTEVDPTSTAGNPTKDTPAIAPHPESTLARNQESRTVDIDPRTGLRTMRGDLSRSIETQNLSLAQIAVGAQDRLRENQQKFYAREQHKRQFQFALIALVLIVLGALLIWFVRSGDSGAGTANEEPQTAQMIIRAESERIIDITDFTPREIYAVLESARAVTDDTRRSIVTFVPTTPRVTGAAALTLEEFLNVANVRFPETLLRHLESDFMLATHARGQATGFLVLKTHNFDTVFVELRNSESILAKEVYPILTSRELQPGSWTDVTLRNINARQYLSQGAQPQLYYAFLDKETIVIAVDELSLIEVTERFTEL